VLEAAYNPSNISNPKALGEVFKNIVMDGTDPDKVVASNLNSTLNLAQQQKVIKEVRMKDGSVKTVSFKENPYTYFDEESMSMKPVMVKNKAGVMVSKLSEDYGVIVPKDIEDIYKRQLGWTANVFGNTEKNILSERVLGLLNPMTEFSMVEKTSAVDAGIKSNALAISNLELELKTATNPTQIEIIRKQLELLKSNISQNAVQTGLMSAQTNNIKANTAKTQQEIDYYNLHPEELGNKGRSMGVGKSFQQGSNQYDLAFEDGYTKAVGMKFTGKGEMIILTADNPTGKDNKPKSPAETRAILNKLSEKDRQYAEKAQENAMYNYQTWVNKGKTSAASSGTKGPAYTK
jgi:DNA-binding protein H-NS